MADRFVRPYAAVFLNGAWVNWTNDVRGLDGATAFKAGKGRANEASRVAASTLDITMNNGSGNYYNRNPSSIYYGQLVENIPIVTGIDYAKATFSTPISNSWGSLDVVTPGIPAQVWTNTAPNSSFNVAAGVGTLTSNGGTYIVAYQGSYGEVEMLTKLSINSVANNPSYGVTFKYQNNNNNYKILVSIVNGRIILEKNKGAGTITIFGNTFVPVAGLSYWMRVSAGKRIRVRIWLDGTTEPTTWHTGFFDDDPFNAGLLSNYGGVGVVMNGGNAGTTVVTYDNFECFNPRFAGEINSYKPKSDSTGNDPYTEIQATGILRRLSLGDKTLDSAMFREATKPSAIGNAAAYWPCEDATGATAPSSALNNGIAMRINGTAPTFASSSVIPGSKPLLTMTSGCNLQGFVPANAPNTFGNIFQRIVMSIPSGVIPNATNILNIYTTGTNVYNIAMIYFTGGNFDVQIRDSAGTVLANTGSVLFNLDNKRFYFAIEMNQVGADINVLTAANVISDDNSVVTGGIFTGTFVGQSLGKATSISLGGQGTMTGCTVGHIGIGNSQAFMFNNGPSLIGNAGENAADRLNRMCTANNIDFYLVGVNTDTVLMGPERLDSLLENFFDCADADQGILYEPRNSLSLAYRTRMDMYNQTPVTLDHSAGSLSNTLDPVIDAQLLANDVTVTRVPGGESARVTITSGPNNVNPPPTGVGTYKKPLDATVYSTDSLAEIAGLRASQGTVDADRHPNMTMQVMRNYYISNPDLRAAVLALDSGDYLAISNPPPWLPPETIKLMNQGNKETYGQFLHELIFNTTPYQPWIVGQVAGTPRIAGETDMVLTSSINAAALSLISQSLSGDQVWCTTTDDAESAADFPFNVTMDGEVITVTDVNRGLLDTCTRTVAAGSWGTASDGIHAYTIPVGTAANFDVNGTVARISLSTLNAEQQAVTDVGASFNQDIRLWCTVPVTPTGAVINWGILLRALDANNYYWADVQIGTDSSLTLRLVKRVAGVATQIATQLNGLAHSTTQPRALRAQIIGGNFRSRIWDPSFTEPIGWHLTASDSDPALTGTTITKVGAVARLATGNTNATPVIFSFDNLTAYSPQILTITRPSNAKSHTPGAVIEVADYATVGR
jgi:hypothetical protein